MKIASGLELTGPGNTSTSSLVKYSRVSPVDGEEQPAGDESVSPEGHRTPHQEAGQVRWWGAGYFEKEAR